MPQAAWVLYTYRSGQILDGEVLWCWLALKLNLNNGRWSYENLRLRIDFKGPTIKGCATLIKAKECVAVLTIGHHKPTLQQCCNNPLQHLNLWLVHTVYRLEMGLWCMILLQACCRGSRIAAQGLKPVARWVYDSLNRLSYPEFYFPPEIDQGDVHILGVICPEMGNVF